MAHHGGSSTIRENLPSPRSLTSLGNTAASESANALRGGTKKDSPTALATAGPALRLTCTRSTSGAAVAALSPPASPAAVSAAVCMPCGSGSRGCMARCGTVPAESPPSRAARTMAVKSTLLFSSVRPAAPLLQLSPSTDTSSCEAPEAEEDAVRAYRQLPRRALWEAHAASRRGRNAMWRLHWMMSCL